MHPDLEALLELQEKDKDVLAVEEELKALEPPIESLDGALSEFEAKSQSARATLDDLGNRRQELESKIESYQVMQERRRQKLDWVRGAKEASVLMAEIDLARTVLAQEEAEWLRSADKMQEAEQRTEEAEKRVTELKAQQEPPRAEIESKRAECNARLAVAMAERENLATSVAKPLLQRYERIRKGRARLALYPIHGDACGHCYTAVPLNVRQQMQQNEFLSDCEACGVMIYYDSAE